MERGERKRSDGIERGGGGVVLFPGHRTLSFPFFFLSLHGHKRKSVKKTQAGLN